MYIKSATVHGFKSYKEPVTIHLSPGCNVVVGRNGAGKSNFFAAIRFVLGDIFTNLRAEERQQLLHEGAGLAVMTAYVELVFDNSDNRFPIDREEVVLRRTVGVKKDEYFLDKKHVTKTDVSNLLESAGFSKSNPYYIVQQGKITTLALMKDSERLELLMEVAGCKVYDERREESERIMKDTEQRREKVVEVVEYIEQRLQDLGDEKEELKEFQTLDRDKRALEYTIYDQELKSAKAHLQRLDDERAELAEELKEEYSQKATDEDTVKELETQVKEAKAEEGTLETEKERLAAEVREVSKRKNKLELDIQDGRSLQKTNADRKDALERDLDDTRKDLGKAEAALNKIGPRFDAQLAKEDELQEEMDDVLRRTKELNSKQGRAARFKTKGERDKYIKREISTLDETLEEQQQRAAALEAEISTGTKQSGQVAGGMEKTQSELAQLKDGMDEALNEYQRLKVQRDEKQDARKEMWRSNEDIKARMKITQDQLVRNERTLMTAWGRDAQKGLNAIHKLILEKKIPSKGVYGPLIELFHVDDKFVTAVETTAGASLSHVVVDNEQTAARIVTELNKQNLGRVTFMPIQNLSVKAMEEVPGPSQDVIPLMSRLTFDSKFEPAFRQVFGKTLIARDTATATHYSRMHKVNCVTLDGDQVNKRGAITGGFNDIGKSRITAMKKVKEAQAQLGQLNAELAEHNKTAADLDNDIASILSDMQKAKSEHRTMKQQALEKKDEMDKDRQTIVFDAGNLEAKKELLANMQKNVRNLTKDRDGMVQELQEPMVKKLSAAEEQELQGLIKRQTDLTKQLPAARQERANIEVQKKALGDRLNLHLKKRENELLSKLAAISSGDSLVASLSQGDSQGDELVGDLSEATIERLEADLAQTTEEEAKLQRAQEENEKKRADNTKTLAGYTKELDKLQKDKSSQDRVGQVEQRMEELLNARATQTTKKETAMKKIRELGSLPADAFEKYNETSVTDCMKKLKKTNEKLKKFDGVNKKALDQFMSFTEQRDDLQGRMEELDTAKASITKLITVLDQRKDDAIQRTFKGVSQHFTQIFKEVVPQGKATLVMLKKKKKKAAKDDASEEDDEDDEEPEDEPGSKRKSKGSSKKKKKKKKSAASSAADDEEDADGEEETGVLAYGGVAIKVSFTGHGDVYYLNQLSGGQKSVVALAFIFAIQRLDPAPFYLFDEIDANLDAAHRTAVANLINAYTQPRGGDDDGDVEAEGTSAQFIATTFRPELVTSAHKCFGVSLRNKVSQVNEIDDETALQFISHEQAAPAQAAVVAD